MLLAKLFPSCSSLRGSCIHEWFRLHGDGRKEKLTAGGQFIVFFLDICYRTQLRYSVLFLLQN
jgi:hypothetical protein